MGGPVVCGQRPHPRAAVSLRGVSVGTQHVEGQRHGPGPGVGDHEAGRVEYERLGPRGLRVLRHHDRCAVVQPLGDRVAAPATFQQRTTRRGAGSQRCVLVRLAGTDRGEGRRYLADGEVVLAAGDRPPVCGHVGVTCVAHAVVSLVPGELRHEPVEPGRPDAPEPLARRGPVAAVLDHAMLAVARPRAGGQVGGGATRKPGRRAIPVKSSPRGYNTSLPAAHDPYLTAIAYGGHGDGCG